MTLVNPILELQFGYNSCRVWALCIVGGHFLDLIPSVLLSRCPLGFVPWDALSMRLLKRRAEFRGSLRATVGLLLCAASLAGFGG